MDVPTSMERSDETTPISNVLRGASLEKFSTKDFLLTSFVIGSPKVAAHRARLGRHSYCFTSSRRYWVWETESWRVYVNNEGGIGFEVPVAFTQERAVEAWNDYKKRMGVTPRRIELMRLRMERASS